VLSSVTEQTVRGSCVYFLLTLLIIIIFIDDNITFEDDELWVLDNVENNEISTKNLYLMSNIDIIIFLDDNITFEDDEYCTKVMDNFEKSMINYINYLYLYNNIFFFSR